MIIAVHLKHILRIKQKQPNTLFPGNFKEWCCLKRFRLSVVDWSTDLWNFDQQVCFLSTIGKAMK